MTSPPNDYIDSPYIVGVPLTQKHEVFVDRADLGLQIRRLLQDQHHQPLFLYGQRRIGKTSLLKNLGRLLPSNMVPLFIDLYRLASWANGRASFLYNIARAIVDSAWRQQNQVLPPLTDTDLTSEPFTGFDRWLDEVERALGQATVLLVFDDFDAFYSALDEGQFIHIVMLDLLLHLVWQRKRFRVLLTSSYRPDELQRWNSHQFNFQILHMSYLNEVEARRLIEHPVQNFPLHYEPNASRRILALTRGHPFLIQLLCTEIVALKNDQVADIRRLVRSDDVEASVPEALEQGKFFFFSLHHQVDATGIAMLRFLAMQGEGAVVNPALLALHFPNESERTLALLIRRELIESVPTGYRFQIELIRRWFVRNENGL